MSIPLQKLIDSTLKLLERERLERKKNTMKYKLLEALKAVDYKDLLERSVWTFLQAFLGVFLFSGALIIDLLFKGDWTGLYALLVTTGIAAAAAGLSAVKTIVLGVLEELRNKE